ncbi:MAG: hypothetical protein Q9170_000344 [Blastenia crenularia]
MSALQDNCNRDNLFRSFIDPRYSASASAFCSAYIRPTAKTIETITTTVPTFGKRDLPATTAFPASRLSSACSCILTATISPTTTATTIVTTVTTTKPSVCSVATPIVKNGDFETGFLAPWTLTQVMPSLEQYSQYLSYGVKGPGYGGSRYALIAKDELASSYVEFDFEQTLTVCPGAKYSFSANYYLTDPGPGSTPASKEVYVESFVDGNLIAMNKNSDPAGPPTVWRKFTGAFTAASGKAQLKIEFVATNFVVVEWGLDHVVVTPA